MNYIGIDLSLTSTAIAIWNDKNGYKFLSYIKNWTKPTKWTKNLMDFVDVKGTEFKTSDDYSEQEVLKLKDYDLITDNIILDIQKILVKGEIIFQIEGYSYSSETSSLIDLVTLSTLLRKKLLNIGAKMIVISPSSLKKEICGIVYGWTKTGVRTFKYSTRNTDGIAGGTFQKHEILKSINDYPCESNLAKFIKLYYSDLYSMKTIPAPIPDLCDAYCALKVLMNDKIFKLKKIINE